MNRQEKKITTLKRLRSNYGQITATITDNPTIMSYDHKSDHPNFLSAVFNLHAPQIYSFTKVIHPKYYKHLKKGAH